MSGAPGPVNGAAHWRQRGELGMRLKTRRPARTMESGCVRYSRQKASS